MPTYIYHIYVYIYIYIYIYIQIYIYNWLEKCTDIITDEWKEFIGPDNCNAGNMFSMVKTHKADNRVRVIICGWNIFVEKLSILVEKTLCPLADRLN